MQQIDDSLYDAFGQRQVAITYATMNQYRVVLEAKPDLVAGPERRRPGLRARPRAAAWRRIRSCHQAASPALPRALDRTSGPVPGDHDSRSTSHPGMRSARPSIAIHRAEAEIGMPASIRADFPAALRRRFTSSLSSPSHTSILAALVTVYPRARILYESLIHPITILSTLPSAGVGALLALLLTKHRVQHHRVSSGSSCSSAS